MFTPWNEVCAVRFRKWGKFSFPSERAIFQQYQAIPLGPAPWNLNHSLEILFPGTLAITSGDELCQQPDVIPLGLAPPAPLKRLQSGKFTPVTEKFIRLNSKTILPRLISLGYLQGVQLGWNLHSTCPIDINGRIEIESFTLLKPGRPALLLYSGGAWTFLSE